MLIHPAREQVVSLFYNFRGSGQIFRWNPESSTISPAKGPSVVLGVNGHDQLCLVSHSNVSRRLVFDLVRLTVRVQTITGQSKEVAVQTMTMAGLRAAISVEFDGVPPDQQRLAHTGSPGTSLPNDPELALADVGVVDGSTLLLTPLAAMEFAFDHAGAGRRSWSWHELRELLCSPEVGCGAEVLSRLDQQLQADRMPAGLMPAARPPELLAAAEPEAELVHNPSAGAETKGARARKQIQSSLLEDVGSFASDDI